jgi:hypothetical protein
VRRLRFVLAALAFLACGATRAPLAGVPSSSSTSTGVLSPAPAVSRCGDADPLAHVFHPNRLQVLVRCQEARGQVLAVEREADGDWHIWLILDGGL